MRTRMTCMGLLVCCVPASLGLSSCLGTMPMTGPIRDLLPTTPTVNLQGLTPRWRKTNLTFFIASFTTKNSQARQIDFVTGAFARWSAVTPLNFTRVMDRAQADLVFGFGIGGHCELYVNNNLTCPVDAAFDAVILAHAYFPNGPNRGQCHLNDVQDWSHDRLLFSTTVHEIGHNLGLEHLNDPTAVMFWMDSGQTGDLATADIAAIQRLYGSRDGTVRPAALTRPPTTDAGVNRTTPTTTLTDTDGDGIDDATELFLLGTSPSVRDSDGDGVDDGVEAVAGLDPTDNDTDGDGTLDGIELDGDGNAFLPDFAAAGDVSALVGKYAGTDSFDTPIQFTVDADGLVLGTLSLTQYGFSFDLDLIGAVDADGTIILLSFDYFLGYVGTIAGASIDDGVFHSEAGATGTWTAVMTPKGKLPDALRRTFRRLNPDNDDFAPLRRPDIGLYEPRRP